MIYNDELDFLQKIILLATGKSTEIRHLQFISGGFVNQSVRVDTNEGKYFIKFNESQPEAIFNSEAKGLKLLQSHLKSAIIPKVEFVGKVDSRQVMVQEYIQNKAIFNSFWENLGKTIAELHSNHQNKAGLNFKTYTNTFEQINDENESWPHFFFQKRLQVQFGMAYYKGIIEKHYLRKLDSLQTAFEALYEHEPFSLLHGNLRKENVYPTTTDQVCMVNPAVYFGHREVDIAIAKLFGGFDELFFKTYHAYYPFLDGNKERMEIYSLYQLMLYVNLYGTSSYLNHINKILEKYI